MESFDPMLAIHCAVTSTNLKGEPEGGWMPDQKLTVQEAVALYTTGSAYTSFEEGYKGKIKEGYLADFIVLSDDIFSIPEEEILSVKVEKNLLGRRTGLYQIMGDSARQTSFSAFYGGEILPPGRKRSRRFLPAAAKQRKGVVNMKRNLRRIFIAVLVVVCAFTAIAFAAERKRQSLTPLCLIRPL